MSRDPRFNNGIIENLEFKDKQKRLLERNDINANTAANITTSYNNHMNYSKNIIDNQFPKKRKNFHDPSTISFNNDGLSINENKLSTLNKNTFGKNKYEASNRVSSIGTYNPNNNNSYRLQSQSQSPVYQIHSNSDNNSNSYYNFNYNYDYKKDNYFDNNNKCVTNGNYTNLNTSISLQNQQLLQNSKHQLPLTQQYQKQQILQKQWMNSSTGRPTLTALGLEKSISKTNFEKNNNKIFMDSNMYSIYNTDYPYQLQYPFHPQLQFLQKQSNPSHQLTEEQRRQKLQLVPLQQVHKQQQFLSGNSQLHSQPPRSYNHNHHNHFIENSSIQNAFKNNSDKNNSRLKHFYNNNISIIDSTFTKNCFFKDSYYSKVGTSILPNIPTLSCDASRGNYTPQSNLRKYEKNSNFEKNNTPAPPTTPHPSEPLPYVPLNTKYGPGNSSKSSSSRTNSSSSSNILPSTPLEPSILSVASSQNHQKLLKLQSQSKSKQHLEASKGQSQVYGSILPVKYRNIIKNKDIDLSHDSAAGSSCSFYKNKNESVLSNFYTSKQNDSDMIEIQQQEQEHQEQFQVDVYCNRRIYMICCGFEPITAYMLNCLSPTQLSDQSLLSQSRDINDACIYCLQNRRDKSINICNSDSNLGNSMGGKKNNKLNQNEEQNNSEMLTNMANDIITHKTFECDEFYKSIKGNNSVSKSDILYNTTCRSQTRYLTFLRSLPPPLHHYQGKRLSVDEFIAIYKSGSRNCNSSRTMYHDIDDDGDMVFSSATTTNTDTFSALTTSKNTNLQNYLNSVDMKAYQVLQVKLPYFITNEEHQLQQYLTGNINNINNNKDGGSGSDNSNSSCSGNAKSSSSTGDDRGINIIIPKELITVSLEASDLSQNYVTYDLPQPKPSLQSLKYLKQSIKTKRDKNSEQDKSSSVNSYNDGTNWYSPTSFITTKLSVTTLHALLGVYGEASIVVQGTTYIGSSSSGSSGSGSGSNCGFSVEILARDIEDGEVVEDKSLPTPPSTPPSTLPSTPPSTITTTTATTTTNHNNNNSNDNNNNDNSSNKKKKNSNNIDECDGSQPELEREILSSFNAANTANTSPFITATTKYDGNQISLNYYDIVRDIEGPSSELLPESYHSTMVHSIWSSNVGDLHAYEPLPIIFYVRVLIVVATNTSSEASSNIGNLKCILLRMGNVDSLVGGPYCSSLDGGDPLLDSNCLLATVRRHVLSQALLDISTPDVTTHLLNIQTLQRPASTFCYDDALGLSSTNNNGNNIYGNHFHCINHTYMCVIHSGKLINVRDEIIKSRQRIFGIRLSSNNCCNTINPQNNHNNDVNNSNNNYEDNNDNNDKSNSKKNNNSNNNNNRDRDHPNAYSIWPFEDHDSLDAFNKDDNEKSNTNELKLSQEGHATVFLAPQPHTSLRVYDLRSILNSPNNIITSSTTDNNFNYSTGISPSVYDYSNFNSPNTDWLPISPRIRIFERYLACNILYSTIISSYSSVIANYVLALSPKLNYLCRNDIKQFLNYNTTATSTITTTDAHHHRLDNIHKNNNNSNFDSDHGAYNNGDIRDNPYNIAFTIDRTSDKSLHSSNSGIKNGKASSLLLQHQNQNQKQSQQQSQQIVTDSNNMDINYFLKNDRDAFKDITTTTITNNNNKKNNNKNSNNNKNDDDDSDDDNNNNNDDYVEYKDVRENSFYNADAFLQTALPPPLTSGTTSNNYFYKNNNNEMHDMTTDSFNIDNVDHVIALDEGVESSDQFDHIHEMVPIVTMEKVNLEKESILNSFRFYDYVSKYFENDMFYNISVKSSNNSIGLSELRSILLHSPQGQYLTSENISDLLWNFVITTTTTNNSNNVDVLKEDCKLSYDIVLEKTFFSSSNGTDNDNYNDNCDE